MNEMEFFGLMNYDKFDAYKLKSLILLITLYANWGRLQLCFAEEWINGPLWFI